jgi:hypothetical protein
MKTLKNLLKLFTIWIISLLALSASIIMFTEKGSYDLKEIAASVAMFMFYSVIFSFPAFVFFTTCSIFVLETKWDIWKKKALMVLLNYIDIIGTGLVFTFLVIGSSTPSADNHYLNFIRKEAVAFYPGWVLIIASTMAIVLMPFKEKTNK